MRTGIITFHCADDFGAMLQAYGLLKWLHLQGIDAELVKYDPFYMTGRYWWIPYIPAKRVNTVILGAMRGFRRNLNIWKKIRNQKRNMKEFRRKYLEVRGVRFWWTWQLRFLKYDCYVLGSDQIWNPEITYGVRKAYFGAFQNKYKKRVVAYAASIGGEENDRKYDAEFGECLKSVDVISLREQLSAPYIEKRFHRKTVTVTDPVLFLPQEQWQEIETDVKENGFILFYETEQNPSMRAYASRLSADKNLKVIELKYRKVRHDKVFQVDYSAGPSEFLGYIHKAAYVITNSFHATAFSIIYKKQFVTFLHKSRGARLSNLLGLLELNSRMADGNEAIDIDQYIDWSQVEMHIKQLTAQSGSYLLNNLTESEVRQSGNVR